MILRWKKSNRPRPKNAAEAQGAPLRAPSAPPAVGLCLQGVTLPPSIRDLHLSIPVGCWLVLSGADDFAKALFCDLCFSYLEPESGKVEPVWKASDVSFVGRSQNTYGDTLMDHLIYGVREGNRKRVETAAKAALSERFRRHLSEGPALEFRGAARARDVELDERDWMEIAEANLLLQRRRAAVIDTTTDFYHIALEQGFRHSRAFLSSAKTVFWLVNEELGVLPADAEPWALRRENKLELTFPTESRSGYIN